MQNRATAADKDTVRGLLNQIYAKDAVQGHKAIMDAEQEYRQNYADAVRCELFHTMIGSTMDVEPLRPDFPGADSVIERLKKILAGL